MRQLTHRVTASLLGGVAALLLGVGPARAQTQTCQFTISAPGAITSTITLSAQGVYCLMTEVATAASFTSGNAIEIAANNVVLDLNGHKVGGQAAGPGTTAFGIRAFQRRNITIKNGTVRGFYVGIFLQDDPPFTTSQGHRVEGVRVEGNTAVGIEVHGGGNVVRGNQVANTGGASFEQYSYGIVAKGPGARILDNDVIDTLGSGGGNTLGITLFNAPSSVVEGNRVGNQTQPPGGAFGIAAETSPNVLIVGNRLLGWLTGVLADGSSNVKCRDNFFAAVTYLFLYCTDVANNN